MSTQPARAQANKPNRWIQLILGIVCMASVANLQYGWTLFVLPIQHHFGWTKAEIQIAFTIFILFETWLVPFEGAIVDNIRISNSTFSGVTDTEVVSHTGTVTLTNVTIIPAKASRSRNSITEAEKKGN